MTVIRPPFKTSSLGGPKPRIVVIIPCYNTQDQITGVIEKSRKYADEVFVVDDGSTDMTASQAREAGATVLQHPFNRGKGAAMKTATANCRADFIVFIDGDGQHNAEEIPDLLLPLIRGHADFVIGSRYSKGSKLTANPFIRRSANWAASLVISLVISILLPFSRFLSRSRIHGESIAEKSSFTLGPVLDETKKYSQYRVLKGNFKWVSDCTSGFTASRKLCWDQLDLVSDHYQIETEVIFEQAKHGYVIAEVPISCTWDSVSSRLSIFKDALQTTVMLTKKLLFFNHQHNSLDDGRRSL